MEIENRKLEDILRVCPRCGRSIECKANDVLNCRCRQVDLSYEETQFIRKEYQECLCNQCLNEMKSVFLDGKRE